VPLARRLARLVREVAGTEPAVGALDISLYRDDFTSLAAQPITKGSDILFSIDGRTVVLVDDVLFTGRTVRAALDQLIDFGRPARIELAVLVDRGHRELPIRADYVGRTLATSREEAVQVLVREEDGRDEVQLVRKPGPTTAPRSAGPRPRAVPKERAGRKTHERRATGRRRPAGKARSRRTSVRRGAR
jgi:pyrimidine operon attenuation protein/uracil phosphoribosyltransferase